MHVQQRNGELKVVLLYEEMWQTLKDSSRLLVETPFGVHERIEYREGGEGEDVRRFCREDGKEGQEGRRRAQVVVVTVKKADAWLSSGEKPTSNITAVNPVDDVMNRLNKTILWISDISFFVLFWVGTY